MVSRKSSRKRLKSARTDKSARTEENLLEASAYCIGNLGLENASITEIAKRAGTSRALVAHYFPQKERLFEQVILYIAKTGLASIEAPTREVIEDPSQKILIIVRSNLDFFMRYKHYYRCFILFYHHASIDPRLRKLNTRFYETAVNRMESVVRELNPRLTAVEVRLHSETLYRSYFFSIQRYFTMDHGLSSDDWRSRTVVEIERLVDWVQSIGVRG